MVATCTCIGFLSLVLSTTVLGYIVKTKLILILISISYRTFIFNQTVGDPESSGIAVKVK